MRARLHEAVDGVVNQILNDAALNIVLRVEEELHAGLDRRRPLRSRRRNEERNGEDGR